MTPTTGWRWAILGAPPERQPLIVRLLAFSERGALVAFDTSDLHPGTAAWPSYQPWELVASLHTDYADAQRHLGELEAALGVAADEIAHVPAHWQQPAQ